MASPVKLPSPLRSVRFHSAEDFVDEVKPYDSAFMAFTLGMAMDFVAFGAPSKDPKTAPTPTPGTDDGAFYAIYGGDHLILVLIQTPLRPAHFLGYPSPPPAPILAAACARLAKAVAPRSLSHQVGGPRDAVMAFLASLPDVRTSPKPFSCTACSARLGTLPDPDPAPAPHPEGQPAEDAPPERRYLIRNALPGDALALVPLALEFSAAAGSASAGAPSPGRVRADMRAAAERGLLYVISERPRASDAQDSGKGEASSPELAGYLLLGFATPRAVAVRHVFVHPAHRRRGLAESLVGAVTRACLGARPRRDGAGATASADVDVDVQVDVPGCGAKSAVRLLYKDPGAARVYRRCGFVVDEDARDPVTGAKLCYAYEIRDIVPS
ncbi:hypothetical protein DAEQUDRAFT_726079 [Daedalea quercina L-15889]|uniref:N-acetyltransferase domain-containing protein n=1 Tax=Daedalea quercina L-15889 TaxID=1314783 RepID=A0A165QQA4_9APHY|nr:hypothetical protein DAEQUDRAFT_726079 [Daedalea quercina L-15889]